MRRKSHREKLGAMLVERGSITGDQLRDALAAQKRERFSIGQILVRLGYLGEEELAATLAEQFGYPYLPLARYEISREVVRLVDEEFARRHCLIAIDLIGKLLTVTVGSPMDESVEREVREMTGFHVQAFISMISDIQKAVEVYYS